MEEKKNPKSLVIWGDYQSRLIQCFKYLRSDNSFKEVTLISEGQTCKAHKMVLSACSHYFRSRLQDNPSTNPIIMLKEVSFYDLELIIEFMYTGEVNVPQVYLPEFLKAAEKLKVKGLMGLEGKRVEDEPKQSN